MDVVDTFRRSELFRDLDDRQLSWVVELHSQIRFDRGQLLFEQGREADRMYILGEGLVGIRTVTEEQGEVLVESLYRPGEVFGWSALVEPYVYTFSARAQEAGSALALPHSPLLSLLQQHPDVGMAVYRGLAGTVASRLHHTRSSLLTILSTGLISQG